MIKFQTRAAWITVIVFMSVISNKLAFTEINSRDLTIIYSGNTLGELKPCGCTKEEDQGGFERRMTFLKEISSNTKNIVLVDTGDSFKEPTKQGKIKARYIMQAISKLKYDAIIPGEKDLVYGEPFINSGESIPWILSNAKLGEIDPPKVRIKKLDNGLIVAILGLIDPELYYDAKHSGGIISDPKESAEKLIAKLKKSRHPDIIILLTHMKREKAISLLKLNGVDVVVNGHIESDTDTIDMTPIKKNGKVFIQPGPRGQKMGKLTIQIDKKFNKTFKNSIIRLDSKIKFDPEMIKWYDEYNNEIEELFFESMDRRKTQHDKKSVYASDQMCMTCHPKKHETWNKSRHGHAYETLKKINKAFDPECLKCHVTGLDRIGGFVSEVDTPELKNVQCEACHGPSLSHVKNFQIKPKADAQQACNLCHVKNHSPNFNYSKYWPKIKH